MRGIIGLHGPRVVTLVEQELKLEVEESLFTKEMEALLVVAIVQKHLK